jgi:hypothetical protein
LDRKIIFLRFLIKTVTSSTGNITCFPSVTSYHDENDYYVDITICKCVFNGVDYNDRSTTAGTDCSKAGTSYTLDYQTENFIFIIILNDLHKLFSFLKENSSFLNRKRENKINPPIIAIINKKERENVFKQVVKKVMPVI